MGGPSPEGEARAVWSVGHADWPRPAATVGSARSAAATIERLGSSPIASASLPSSIFRRLGSADRLCAVQRCGQCWPDDMLASSDAGAFIQSW